MESEISPLFDRLDPDTGGTPLADCLAAMGCTSVFDIVRHSKPRFAGALRRQEGAGDWDAEEIYDNAVSYAIQLYRSFLEHELHADDSVPTRERRGVRGLIEHRPDYPTLFQENWDAFCRAGAFESRYGPAAYLSELYHVATEDFEKAEGDAGKRLLLARRRPDLAEMIVEPGTMNEPMPMLTLVNEIMMASIEDFRRREDATDERPLLQVFAERFYPLQFPYHQPHHKVQLVLERRRLTLGGLQLLAQPLDRRLYGEGRVAAAATSLCFCNALSPPQQAMLVVPPPFAMFNLTRSDLENAFWDGPRLAALMFDLPPDRGPGIDGTATRTLFLTYIQEGVVEGPQREGGGPWSNGTLSFPDTVPWRAQLNGTWTIEGGSEHAMNDWSGGSYEERRTRLRLQQRSPLVTNYTVRFAVAPYTGHPAFSGFGVIAAGFDIALHLSDRSTDDFALDASQQQYLQERLGTMLVSGRDATFERVSSLLSRLGIGTEELDQLLARGRYAPAVSPHIALSEVVRDGGYYEAAASAPYQYGAVYVHGGMPETMEIEDASEDPEAPQWRLTELTPDRLDRLQRMVRLQRWTGLSYEELDVLVTAASRAEARLTATPTRTSDIPLTSTLSSNAMRLLGGFACFKDKYGISASDFAAIFNRMAVHGLGGKPSQFDRWFNPPPLSGTPFVLDHSELPVSLEGEGIEAGQRAAVGRLCAALGMLPVETSYGTVAQAVLETMLVQRGPLYLSRNVVSAFFRICRAARMFGVDATDLLSLLNLLDATYQALALKPRLRAPGASAEPDTLDVWLEVSAVIDWLSANRWSVATLMHLLYRDGGRLAADNGLLQLIRSVAVNLAATRATEATIAHPDLTADIDWVAVLQAVAIDGKALVADNGLVATPELMPPSGQQRSLAQYLRLNAQLPGEGTVRPTDAEAAALAERVLALAQAQERTLAIALNQAMGVPDDAAALVVRWAGEDADEGDRWTIAEFLAETLAVAGSGEIEPGDVEPAYLAKVYAIRRHALVRDATALSAQALYVLLRHPVRFGLADSRLSLDALYLLTRYRDWRKVTGVEEDVLFAYLASSAHDTGRLATLLDWPEAELGQALDETTLEPTWRTLNVLLCRKVASDSAALPMAALRALVDLDLEDDWPTWSAAGDAATSTAS